MGGFGSGHIWCVFDIMTIFGVRVLMLATVVTDCISDNDHIRCRCSDKRTIFSAFVDGD